MRIGMMAEVGSPHELVETVRALRRAGVVELDAFAPFDVPELTEAMQKRRSRIPYLAGAAGIAAGAAAYGLQYWMWVVDYPVEIGGHPHHTPLAYLPIAFEMAVLFAALTAFVAAIVGGGLPRLWHPVFEVDGFESATEHGYWVAIGEQDVAKAEGFLAHARKVVRT